MTCGIYCYIDKKDNNIVYVGKDSNIDKNRRNQYHHSPSKYQEQQINRVLQNNPNRYTYQVLTWNVTDQDTLNALETQYITHLKPKFNYTMGGEGLVGFRHSEMTKNKISEKNKGKTAWNKGKSGIYSEKTLKKFSDARKGKKLSQKTKDKISFSLKGKEAWNKGISHTIDSKMKMSHSRNNTGFYCVSKQKNKNLLNGFTWRYTYYENGKQQNITSVDLFKLRDKVLAKNLEWCIIDKQKAQKTIESLERLK